MRVVVRFISITTTESSVNGGTFCGEYSRLSAAFRTVLGLEFHTVWPLQGKGNSEERVEVLMVQAHWRKRVQPSINRFASC